MKPMMPESESNERPTESQERHPAAVDLQSTPDVADLPPVPPETYLDRLGERDKETVEQGVDYYMQAIMSQIAEAEGSLRTIEQSNLTAETLAGELTDGAISWLRHESDSGNLGGEIFSSDAARRAYDTAISTKAILVGLRGGDKAAMAQAKQIVSGTPNIARSKTKFAFLEAKLAERLDAAEDEALLAGGEKPLNEDNFTAENHSSLRSLAHMLISADGDIDQEMRLVTPHSQAVNELLRIGGIDKIDYEFCAQQLRIEIISQLPRPTDSLDTAEAVARLSSGLYSDATLAGNRARTEIKQHGLDTSLIAAYKWLLQARGTPDTRATLWSAHSLRRLTELGQASDENFARATLAGDIVLEHTTPFSLEVMKNGGLKPKYDHGLTSTNDLDASNQIHFTTYAELPSGKALDYRTYATHTGGNTGHTLRNNPKIEHFPGIFTIGLADAIRGGLDRVHTSLASVEGQTRPEDLVLSQHDGDDARFSLGSLSFTTVERDSNSNTNPMKFADLARAELTKVQLAYKGKDMGTWPEFRAANYHPETILQTYLIDCGIDLNWVEHNTSPDLPTLRQRVQTSSAGRVVVPLAQVREFSTSVDPLDANGNDSLRLPTMYMGVCEAVA